MQPPPQQTCKWTIPLFVEMNGLSRGHAIHFHDCFGEGSHQGDVMCEDGHPRNTLHWVLPHTVLPR